jgi:hypothetical protein
MPIYEQYDPQTGQIIEVWEAEQMTHPPQRHSPETKVKMSAAEQLGVPMSEIDLSQGNLGVGGRAGLGYLSDQVAEEIAYLQKVHPGSEVINANGTLVVRTPDGQILTPNPPGFEPLGSSSQFLGRTGPGIIGGTAGAAAGAGGGPWLRRAVQWRGLLPPRRVGSWPRSPRARSGKRRNSLCRGSGSMLRWKDFRSPARP